MFFERDDILLLGRYGCSIYLGFHVCYSFFGDGMFYYLVWVDMYTLGGSAFEFPLFIVHGCLSIEKSESYFLKYRWTYLYIYDLYPWDTT